MKRFLLALLLLLPLPAISAPAPITVPTIAALKAGNFSSYATVQVLGYNTAGDGGGGFFNWAPASVATDDKCVTIKATPITTGRWVRQFNGQSLSVEMCGAYHDGTNAATTLAAFQAANDYVAASSNHMQPILMDGPLYNFGSGTTGVVKASSFDCPNWVGRGASTNDSGTVVQFTPPSEAAAFTFIGGSGSICGGGIKGVTFHGNANTVAVELQGQGGATLDIKTYATMKRAVLFHNKTGGQFTEFNNVTLNTNGAGLATAVEYRVTSGDASFHGSGIVGGTIVYDGGTAGAILVNTGAFPYNAPLSATFFPASGSSAIVRIANITAFGQPWFNGNIKVEQGGASEVYIGAGSEYALVGDVSYFGDSEDWFMGTAYTVYSFGSLANSQRYVFFKPINIVGNITGATTTIPWPLNSIYNSYQIFVEVAGNNYRAQTTSTMFFSEGSVGHDVLNPVNNLVTNTAGYGNIVVADPSGAGIQLTAASTPFVTGQNLKYYITLTQVGQGSDHHNRQQ